MTLRLEAPKVSDHIAKFGGHRHCSSENTMIFVCYVIYEDHLIEG